MFIHNVSYLPTSLSYHLVAMLCMYALQNTDWSESAIERFKGCVFGEEKELLCTVYPQINGKWPVAVFHRYIPGLLLSLIFSFQLLFSFFFYRDDVFFFI